MNTNTVVLHLRRLWSHERCTPGPRLCCKSLLPVADIRATKAELASYKAEVRAKSTAVGKAEVVLNEVCLAMASRLGRADGTRIAANTGRVLSEVSIGEALSRSR